MNYDVKNMMAWVKGNDVLLDIYLYEWVDAETRQAFNLQLSDNVKVRLVNTFGRTFDIEALPLDGHDNGLVIDILGVYPCGTYSVEITLVRGGRHVRSFESPLFRIVERNADANMTFDIVSGGRRADTEIEMQVVAQAVARGKNAYEMWKELPGNEDKSLQDYIDEVLDFHRRADEINAQESARQGAEAMRVEAETERGTNEHDRMIAEDAREQSELSREAAETRRETAEGERARAFDTAQAGRAEAFRIAEAARQSDFETGEGMRAAGESVRQTNEAARQASEATRENNESERRNAESSRVEYEKIRANGESSRVRAEAQRQVNETTRQTNETQRQGNETTRQTNETTRQTNETTRQTNETQRQGNEEARQSAETKREQDMEEALAKADQYTRRAGAAADAAEAAANDARQAEEGANNAAANATTAAGNAAAKATLADAAASLASAAATAADSAAQSATSAAGSADTAAQDASIAARTATEAAQTATTAATNAAAAATGAQNVDADVNGSVVSVTNRRGVTKTVDVRELMLENKQDKLLLGTVAGSTEEAVSVTLAANSYVTVTGTVNTLTITLPAVSSLSTEYLDGVVVMFTTGATPNVTIQPASGDEVDIKYFRSFEIAANLGYELNFVWNGACWIASYGIIE